MNAPLKLKPEAADPAQARKYALLTADELAKRPKDRGLIKRILPASGLGAVVGPSMSGKTFLAFDLAVHVANEWPWFGYRSRRASVTYLGLEGHGGIPCRVEANERRHGLGCCSGIRFVLQDFSLFGVHDVPALAEAINTAGHGEGLVIIDTLARAAPGADENSGQDMGAIIASATQLQQSVGGLVLLIHHVGKIANGPRGHSSLMAALDVSIEVQRNGDARAWTLAKSKDGADGQEHAFRLDVEVFGEDEDGDAITSCVVVPDDQPAETVRRAPLPSGGNQRLIYDALAELLRTARHFGEGEAPPTRPCILFEDAISKTRDRLTCSSDRKTERARQAFSGLITRGCIQHRDGWVYLA